MRAIKIYPPSQLPTRTLSETQFNIWKEELEVYLSQEKAFKVFLPGQLYEEWESAETYSDRVRALHHNDVVNVNRERNADQVAQDNEDKLSDIRIHLRTVLAIVGKCVSEAHYNTVVRHSTSLNWIYDTIRADYNIQSKGIHFLNVLDIKYDPEKHTPVGFYNEYRTVIINNLAREGDVIKYKNNENMRNDEKMSPTLEDIVLLDVIREIDPRLPLIVRNFYNHKLKADERLMDYKADILVNIPVFLTDLQKTEADVLDKEASLNAFKRLPFKKNKKTAAPSQLYCRLCYLAKMPKDIYTSHNLGDSKCSQLSFQDRRKLKDSFQLNILKTGLDDESSEEDTGVQFGYHADRIDINDSNEEEVNQQNALSQPNELLRRNNETIFNYIRPVPSQILTVFKDRYNKVPLHIELDSGASINFCQESAALSYGFKINYNTQVSKLGDGETIIKSIGEVNELFYRNDWTIKYRAVVCKKLSSPFIGGTVFLQDNKMEQDFASNTIKLFNRAVTVQPTDPLSLLPTAPLKSEEVIKKNVAKFLTFDSQWLLPDQDLHVTVPTSLRKESLVAVQSCESSKNSKWPDPELKAIKDGKIHFVNKTDNPIHLGKEVKRCTLYPLEVPKSEDSNYYEYRQQFASIMDECDSSPIKFDHINCPETKRIIMEAHDEYKDTFNKDLSKGYNNFYGTHLCSLNWASSERPTASKVHVASYDHDMKVLQQEVMDDLTNQNVLLIPQEHGIVVQSICPSFIQRKQRARDIPKNKLTKNDVRLLINFGPVNDKIKPLPIHVPKINDVFVKMGRWKHVICLDLYNGYFQLKMKEDAIPWLGIQTPFGGMRVVARAGQGLLGMAEEFEELTSKILKEEMQEGICSKIVDDIYIGGKTQKETALNYVRILAKFHNANLKISPNKTSIFPKSVDVLGWVWKEGGLIEPSPHRKTALENTRKEDSKTVKDIRSWIGLYKTLHIAMPKLALILSPFEEAIK